MSAEFDPYFKWLGIPPEDQPPNHYRLLAIPLFTSDPEVIENAADQRMAHLKLVQTGKRGALSQTLLNQIAQAKVCLLDKDQKSEYDRFLRSSVVSQLLRPEAEPFNVPQVQAVTPSRRAVIPKKPAATKELLKIVLGGVAGLVLICLIISWFRPEYDFLGALFENRATEQARPATAPPVRASNNPRQDAAVTDRTINYQQAGESASPVPSISTQGENSNPPTAPPVPPDKRAVLTEKRDAAIGMGDLITALRVASELAELNGTSDLDEQLSLISDWKTESPTAQREVATQLVKLLEQAVAEGKFDLSTRHVDRLLALARLLDDQELQRRATLIALKRPAR